jgi:hypothetical protein
MDTDHSHDRDQHAERTTRLLAHLDGVLDAAMLDAMQGAWSMLELAATDSPAHARAVRSRMVWSSLQPGAFGAEVAPLVTDLVATWDEPVEGDSDLQDAA